MTEEQQILNNRYTELFVGNNYYFYKKHWQDKPENQSFSSWNWLAFLFPLYWLAYRKMYLEAFLYGIASLFAMIIPLGGLILRILMGVYANSYYRKKGVKIIAQTSGMFRGEAEQYISKHGGTSVLAVFITILIVVFLFIAVIAGILLYPTGEEEVTTQTTLSNTDTVNGFSFAFPNNWEQDKTGDYYDTLWEDDDVSTGVLVYNKMDLAGDTTPDDIFVKKVYDFTEDNFKNIKLIDDVKEEEYEDKRTKKIVYTGEQNGHKYYLVLSFIEFKDSEKFAFLFHSCYPSNYEKYKMTFDEITSSCTPVE